MGNYALPFAQVATQALQGLQQSLRSPVRLNWLLNQLGWQANDATFDLAAVRSALDWSTSLTTLTQLADDFRHQRGDVLSNAEDLLAAIKDLFQRIDRLRSAVPNLQQAPFSLPGFWPAVADDLPPLLLASALRQASPLLYGVLRLVGVVEETFTTPTTNGRRPYQRVRLHWNALGDFLGDPVGTLATRYGWGAGRTLDYQRVLREVGDLLELSPINGYLGLTPAAIADRYYTHAELESRRIQSFILPFVRGILPDASGLMELGLSLTPIPAPSGSTLLTHTAPAGFLLAPYLHGSGARSIALRRDLRLDFVGHFASDDAVGLEILPGAVHLRTDVSSTEFAAAVNLVGTPARPIRFFGSDTTSRVELTGYALSVGLAGTVASPELLLRLGTALAGGPGRLVVSLEPGDGDNFLARAFGPDPIKLEIGGALTWSSRTGLGLDGSVGLHLRRAPNKTVGPLTLRDYTVDVAGQSGAPLTAAVTVGGSLKIGPVTATVEGLGVSFQLAPAAGGQKGLLDNLDVSWHFKGPTGVGLSIDSDLVTGGGYLLLDPAHHKYGGVAQLKITLPGGRFLDLTALGILQTELPDNPDAYSLVVLIAATFSPIQLGLGFTLGGLGGLVGINRQADTDFLRGLVRAGEIDRLLFPGDVRTDPAGALALVESAYPAREGRYLIGLAARLSWGTASLITLDVALLVELPAPVRIIILGVLQAAVKEKDLVVFVLRADFLGYVDFGARKVSFDAKLTGSKLLFLTLTGDLAFRLYGGDNPLFVLTAGGFHPQFQPPAGAALTGLNRLRLSLADGDSLRLSLSAYFALTSNTVQFGAHLELYLRLVAGLRVEGHFGFDVLIQFSPFRLLAHIEASVAILRGSTELLGLGLSLDATGPQPWHIWGEASFRIFGFKVGVGVDASFGDASQPLPLARPNVRQQLVEALGKPASWEIEPPQTKAQPGGVTLRPVVAASGELFIDSRAALVLRQRVVPLKLAIQKLGTSPAAPVDGSYFELLDLQLNGATVGTQDDVRDFFARDQVQALSDAQRLSLPSFERLPAGRRLSNLGRLTAGSQLTHRVVTYEQQAVGGTRRRLDGAGRLLADQYERLGKGGPLGAAVAAATPSARAPQPVRWADATYAVVQAATLAAYGSGHAAYPTRVEAEAACRELLAAAPAEELLVVAGYELPTA